MSNAPPTWELLLVPEGSKKIAMEMDTKIPNAATFLVLKEYQPLMQGPHARELTTHLLTNPKVLFAGYKMPHPLEHQFVLKIQTTPDTTPLAVLQAEINTVISQLAGMIHNFENELTLHGIEDANYTAQHIEPDF